MVVAKVGCCGKVLRLLRDPHDSSDRHQTLGLSNLRELVGVRGSFERDISSLRALGPGGGQISRVVHVSTRAAFGVWRGNSRLGGEYVNPGMSR